MLGMVLWYFILNIYKLEESVFFFVLLSGYKFIGIEEI